MTVVQWSALAGWMSISVMAAAYLVGSTGRCRRGSGVLFLLGSVAAFAIVVVRFAQAI